MRKDSTVWKDSPALTTWTTRSVAGTSSGCYGRFQALTRLELTCFVVALTVVLFAILVGTYSRLTSKSFHKVEVTTISLVTERGVIKTIVVTRTEYASSPSTTTEEEGGGNYGACTDDSGHLVECPVPDTGYLNW
ncbi:unnamed protein product [Zymoseptoria tritici ST99CH_3D1]|nr:unnamed protein product [Zymoseptoria tritici ST99CH_3D1]